MASKSKKNGPQHMQLGAALARLTNETTSILRDQQLLINYFFNVADMPVAVSDMHGITVTAPDKPSASFNARVAQVQAYVDRIKEVIERRDDWLRIVYMAMSNDARSKFTDGPATTQKRLLSNWLSQQMLTPTRDPVTFGDMLNRMETAYNLRATREKAFLFMLIRSMCFSLATQSQTKVAVSPLRIQALGMLEWLIRDVRATNPFASGSAEASAFALGTATAAAIYYDPDLGNYVRSNPQE